MTAIHLDLKYSARKLWADRALSAVLISLLALGVGVTTVAYSLIDALFLRPLPELTAPERLVALYGVTHPAPDQLGFLAYADYLDFRRERRVFTDVAAFSLRTFSLTGDFSSERVIGLLVSDNYFTALGIQPALGRFFDPRDEKDARLIVLGHGLWKRRFGSSSKIIGQSVTVNGENLTVIGVAPANFQGTSLVLPSDIFMPLALHRLLARGLEAKYFSNWEGRGTQWLEAFGRLAPGVELVEANAALDVLSKRLAREYPKTNQERGFQLMPLTEQVFGIDQRKPVARYVGLLMALALFMMLVACIVVGGLLVTRGLRRRNELAIRFSVGASRVRVIRLIGIESMLLALIAGGTGVGLAYLALPLLDSLQLPVRAVIEVDLNLRILGFALAASLASGVIFGLLPALYSSRARLVPALRGELPVMRHRSPFGLRDFLVSLQIGVATLLLIGYGLFYRTLRNVEAIDPGFQPDRILLASLDLSNAGYEGPGVTMFFRELTERLKQLPGVEAVGMVGAMPIFGAERVVDLEVRVNSEATPDGEVPANDGEGVRHVMVGADFFGTLGMTPRLGRSFSSEDWTTAGAIVVNESMARRFWPDQNPIGSHVYLMQSNQPFEVIGVMPDTKSFILRQKHVPVLYLSHEQNELWWLGSMLAPEMTLLIRTRGNPLDIVPDLRQTVESMDRNLPLIGITTLAGRLNAMVGLERQTVVLFGVFGLLAIALTVFGLYGVITHAVVERTHEIGVRVACGATPRGVIGLFVRRGLALSLLGVAGGLAGAWALRNLVASRLYGVSSVDPVNYLTAASAVLAVTFVACCLAARGAARMDPVANLREL